MLTNVSEPILQELNIILHQPWNEHAERNMELFQELSTCQGGVTALVSSPQAMASHHAISAISFLLTEVELYRNEIDALYVWLAAVSDRLDEDNRGNLTTAIHRHMILVKTGLPDPSIQRIMLPFLLNCLQVDDWTTRSSAVISLSTLDRMRRLEQWLTVEQLTELKQNFQVHLRLEEEQENFPPMIGRLKRFI